MPSIFDDLLDEKNDPKPNIDLPNIYAKWQNKTFYEIMGVAQKDSCKAINEKTRKQYFRYIRFFHEDKFQSHPHLATIHDIYVLVKNARETLINERSKQLYDLQLETRGTTYSTTFSSGNAPEAKKPRPASPPKAPLAEKYWKIFVENISEAGMKQFLRDNPDKLNVPFYSSTTGQTTTPLIYACQFGLQANPQRFLAVKHLLLNGVQIPFLSENKNAQVLKQAFNTMIAKADHDRLDIQREKILSDDDIFEIVDQNPHFIYYLDTPAKTVLLYVFARRLDLPLLELITESIGDITYLKSVMEDGPCFRGLINTISYSTTNNTSFEKLLEVFRFFMSKVSLSRFDTLELTLQYDKITALKALLCCGVYQTSPDYFYYPKTIKDPLPAYAYLASLPDCLITFYRIIKDLPSVLPWGKVSEDFIHGLEKVIQTCCVMKIQTEDDIRNPEFTNFMINAVFSYIDSLKSNPEMNRFVPFLLANYQLKLLCYNLPCYIRPAPITGNIAASCLTNKKPGDCILHYGDSGNYAITYVKKDLTYQSEMLREYFNNCSSENKRLQLITVNIEEIFNFRTSLGESVLHCVAKMSSPNATSNIALLELLSHEQQARQVINAKDGANKTALFYAAHFHFNKDACEKMVRLGATTDVFYVNSYLIKPFDNIPYIPMLIKLQQDRPGEQVGQSEAKRRLGTIKISYANQASAASPSNSGQLNLTILNGGPRLNVSLEHANATTIACAMLSENISLIKSLLYYGRVITPNAFKIALLTENKELIELVFMRTHRSHWPSDLADVLKHCSVNTNTLVQTFLHSELGKDTDEQLFNSIFAQAMAAENAVAQLTDVEMQNALVVAQPVPSAPTNTRLDM